MRQRQQERDGVDAAGDACDHGVAGAQQRVLRCGAAHLAHHRVFATRLFPVALRRRSAQQAQLRKMVQHRWQPLRLLQRAERHGAAQTGGTLDAEVRPVRLSLHAHRSAKVL